MSLHEETDAELKAKLSSGELGDKKTAVAEAVLRRRRAERISGVASKARMVGSLGGRVRIDCFGRVETVTSKQ